MLALTLASAKAKKGPEMDGLRFDTIVNTLHTRRAALGLAAGLGSLLGLGLQEAAEARCKKKCGPCKRCRQGKCEWKRGAPRCGPRSYCEGGHCRALCPTERCNNNGQQEFCDST